ncbi:hypothetical protein D3C87_1208740 [compost metagenome]
MIQREQHRAIVSERLERGAMGVVVAVRPEVVQPHFFDGTAAADDGAEQGADLGHLLRRALPAAGQCEHVSLQGILPLRAFAVAIGAIGVVQVEERSLGPQQPELVGLVRQFVVKALPARRLDE